MTCTYSPSVRKQLAMSALATKPQLDTSNGNPTSVLLLKAKRSDISISDEFELNSNIMTKCKLLLYVCVCVCSSTGSVELGKVVITRWVDIDLLVHVLLPVCVCVCLCEVYMCVLFCSN